MDVGAALVADQQAAEAVQPGEAALDHPALATEAGAVLGPATADLRPGPPLADLSAVTVVVVAAVGEPASGTSPRRPDAAAQRRPGVKQGQQLGDVVRVAAGQGAGERDAGGVDEQVVPRAGAAPVDRARPRRGAPFLAGTWLESATTREKSIAPAARRRASSRACSSSQTPAHCHSSRRRQQVMPEPQPSSGGRCRQALPVCSTKRMPHSAGRSGRRLAPRVAQAPRMRGQQRLDQLPELVGHDPWTHGHRDPSRRDAGRQGGSPS